MGPTRADAALITQRTARGDRGTHGDVVVFMFRGYAAVSMEDIARAAGVTRPIVYWPGSTALLPNSSRHRPGSSSSIAKKQSAPARSCSIAGAVGSMAAARSCWYTEELGELRFETIIRYIHVQLKAVAPDGPEPDAEAAAHAISGVGERLGHWWLTRPDLSREQIVELYVSFIWRGVSPYVPADA